MNDLLEMGVRRWTGCIWCVLTHVFHGLENPEKHCFRRIPKALQISCLKQTNKKTFLIEQGDLRLIWLYLLLFPNSHISTSFCLEEHLIHNINCIQMIQGTQDKLDLSSQEPPFLSYLSLPTSLYLSLGLVTVLQMKQNHSLIAPYEDMTGKQVCRIEMYLKCHPVYRQLSR